VFVDFKQLNAIEEFVVINTGFSLVKEVH
jgi:hypothetical protein